jgi:hypothetical protein
MTLPGSSTRRTASLLEQFLAPHDDQLGAIKLKDLTTAINRFEHFIRSQRASPLPNELRVEARKFAAEQQSESEATGAGKAISIPNR